MSFSNSRTILKSEISLLAKRDKKWTIRCALYFPNSYNNAMSNLGFLTVFKKLHEFPQFYPQRFFGKIGNSLEENQNISAFPLILISVPFEMDYLNIVEMFIDNGIPLKSEARENTMVIIGGAAPTINPVPLSMIADGIFIGEGEEYIDEILRVFSENPPGMVDKKQLLDRLSMIDGLWIPQNNPVPLKRVVSHSQNIAYSPIISSFASFANMALVQIQRGCPFKCPFCATPCIYNPFINYPIDEIIEKIELWEHKFKRVKKHAFSRVLFRSLLIDQIQHIADVLQFLQFTQGEFDRKLQLQGDHQIHVGQRIPLLNIISRGFTLQGDALVIKDLLKDRFKVFKGNHFIPPVWKYRRHPDQGSVP